MGKTVLIVEDNNCLRTLLGAYLSKSFTVVTATNGLDAMSRLSMGFVPDVIVTDSEMPELNGSELLDNLRVSGIFRHIPVVVVSGSGSPDEERYFRQRGANAYMRKPFNPVMLANVLTQQVNAPVAAYA